MDAPEVLLVYKKSKLALYVHEKKNPRYERLLEEGGQMATALEAAHAAHTETLAAVKQVCVGLGLKVRTHYRARVTKESTRGRLVITVGGDGTVLDASHKFQTENGGTLLGVNSDPERSVGFLCAARKDNFEDILQKVLDKRLSPTPLPRVRGDIDGTPLPFPVLNEVLFAHRNPAGTTRYSLAAPDHPQEQHKSSGLWVAGPVGSTAAIASAGGRVLDLDDPRLQVVVREPYFTIPSDAPKIDHLCLERTQALTLRSRIREGRLYLDGPHKIVTVPVGTTLTLDLNAPPLPLVVTDEMTERRAALKRMRRAQPTEGVPPGCSH